jgi:hypothetical protein
MPGIALLRSYKREWLPKDLIAGLVLSALLVPQGMAHAELAGLPSRAVHDGCAWWPMLFSGHRGIWCWGRIHRSGL